MFLFAAMTRFMAWFQMKKRGALKFDLLIAVRGLPGARRPDALLFLFWASLLGVHSGGLKVTVKETYLVLYA